MYKQGISGFAVSIIIVITLGVGISIARIGCAPAQGTAEAVERTFDGDNMLQTYEWFFDAKGTYESRLSDVEGHHAIMAGELSSDERSRYRIELVGMQQTCRKLANEYNQNSQKANRSMFKSKGLPMKLDAEACKGTTP